MSSNDSLGEILVNLVNTLKMAADAGKRRQEQLTKKLENLEFKISIMDSKMGEVLVQNEQMLKEIQHSFAPHSPKEHQETGDEGEEQIDQSLKIVETSQNNTTHLNSTLETFVNQPINQNQTHKREIIAVPANVYDRVKIYVGDLLGHGYVTQNHFSFKIASYEPYSSHPQWKLIIRANELRAVHRRPVRKNDRRPRLKKYEWYVDSDEVNAINGRIIRFFEKDKTHKEVGLYLNMRDAGYIKKEDREEIKRTGKPKYLPKTIIFSRKELRQLSRKISDVVRQTHDVIPQENAKVVRQK